MKIVIASDLHYPTINGVATFARNLARGLADHGHEVLVIAPSQTGKKCKEVDGNHVIVRTVSVPFPFYQNFKISLNPTREVKKIINDFDPDTLKCKSADLLEEIRKSENKLCELRNVKAKLSLEVSGLKIEKEKLSEKLVAKSSDIDERKRLMRI